MISYYDILTMIKEGNKPPIIKYKDPSGTHIYKFDKEQGEYISKGNHHFIFFDMRLMEIFEKNIEIIKPKKMERLKIENDNGTDYYIRNIHGTKCYLTKHSKIMADKINEIIEVLNEKEKVQNNQK